MAEKSEQPIIIRRKKVNHAGHHGGAWKVAFADFMTAMMAFFLVMWLVGQKDDVRQAVAGYFRDPGNYNTEGKSGVLEGSISIIEAEGPSTGKAKTEKTGSGPSDQEKSQLTLVAKSILTELTKQQAFQNLKDNVTIQLTSEGLRIVLNESENSPAFFEPGSAKLLQKSAVILITIASELGTLGNRIVLEGHTDAAFGGNNVYSNWELSADRANSARSLMDVSGLWDGQVREVRGFAAEYPMIKKDPYDHRNRRVTIVVLYETGEHQYDHIEIGAELMDDVTG